VLVLLSAQNVAKCESILLNKESAILELTDTVNIMEQQNNTYQAQIDTLTQNIEILRRQIDKQDRGGERGERRIMEVTAYWEGSCGKAKSDPLYGITASGERVKEWFTIAAGKELPMGTKVYIPHFRDKPNKGIFTVKDRGGMITNGHLDIYMTTAAACFEFGRQQLEVYILD